MTESVKSPETLIPRPIDPIDGEGHKRLERSEWIAAFPVFRGSWGLFVLCLRACWLISRLLGFFCVRRVYHTSTRKCAVSFFQL